MKNFIIVGTQRIGSGMLADIINSYDQMAVGWEWTQDSVFFDKINYANKALSEILAS
jgi:hypothetical protein